jgi:hypothetical protein
MNPTREIPPCPAGGEGVHRWLMSAAWRLRASGESADRAAQYLAARITRRPTPPNEIIACVAKVYGTQTSFADRRAWPAAPAKWPTPNSEQIEAACESGIGLVDLWERSPLRFHGPATEEILPAMFPAECLLCMAPDNRSAKTAPFQSWRGRMGDNQFVVPSPMAAPTGRTQDARESARCLGNTGPRRYLVTEFDSGTTDEQSACISHLADRAPLVMVLHSGGKSLHAWWRAHGTPEEVLRRFFRAAVTIGADPATWTRCQLVRTPDARRDNGERQSVYYFNPTNLPEK